MDKKRIVYFICDKNLIEISKNIPNIKNRGAVVYSLISAYNLLPLCEVCSSEEANDEILLSFHSNDYIECLKKIQMSDDLEKMNDSEEIAYFNLGYDCPLFDRMYDFAKIIAGGSLTAAKQLIKGTLQFRKKLQSTHSDNSQPKSYLKFKNCLKEHKENNDFELPDNFMDENDWFQTGNYNGHNKKFEKNSNRKYENEVSMCITKIQPISINWFGGWHHAQRDEAGGFCYVNDIVIAIQYLLKFCKRILYVDLDVHHGNGVENAFLFSSKVLSFSLHKFETGFYPASGSLEDIGKGNGKYYTVNVPLKGGITDERYMDIFKKIFTKIMEKFKPYCVVVQCGADSLPGDPLGGFNLTPKGLGECLKLILSEKLPTMILGGGGYNIINTSKCWAYLTSIILDYPISNDIPDNAFLHLYGPEFELGVIPSLRKDENSIEYVENVIATVLDNLNNLPYHSLV